MAHLGRNRVLLGFLGGSIACFLTVGFVNSLPGVTSNVGLILSYGAIWIPLGLGIMFAASAGPMRSIWSDLGLRFRPTDLLWGLSTGILLRVMASLFSVLVTGQLPAETVRFALPAHDAWWVFGAVVAPVLIAPVIEELFFRGLGLRYLLDPDRRIAPRFDKVAVVLVSSVAFTLLHLTEANSPTQAIVTGLSIITFAVTTSILSVMTRRLSGTLIAHVVFNIGALTQTP